MTTYDITLHHDAFGSSTYQRECVDDAAARAEADALLSDAGYGWRATVWAEHMGCDMQMRSHNRDEHTTRPANLRWHDAQGDAI